MEPFAHPLFEVGQCRWHACCQQDIAEPRPGPEDETSAAIPSLVTGPFVAGRLGDSLPIRRFIFFNADPVNHTVDFVIELQQTLDLQTYTKIPLDASKLSIDGDGYIRYQLDTTEERKFFRAGWVPVRHKGVGSLPCH